MQYYNMYHGASGCAAKLRRLEEENAKLKLILTGVWPNRLSPYGEKRARATWRSGDRSPGSEENVDTQKNILNGVQKSATTILNDVQFRSQGGRMPTLYDIKPAFQARLRPLAGGLAAAGVMANQVTLAACALSLVAGAAIAFWPQSRSVFWLLPLVLFVRMALNAIDGMLAREHGQASKLGMFLNEICDVVSDLALILPFAAVAAFPAWGVAAFAIVAVLTEFAGVLGIAAGAGRRYDGPVGKSDRALALGVVATALAIGAPLGPVAPYIFPLLALLSLATVMNRVRAALKS